MAGPVQLCVGGGTVQFTTLDEAAKHAHTWYAQITERSRAEVLARTEFGRMCRGLKAHLGHGRWLGFCDAQGWHPKTVQNAVALAEKADAGIIDPAAQTSLHRAEIAAGIRSQANTIVRSLLGTPPHATDGVPWRAANTNDRSYLDVPRGTLPPPGSRYGAEQFIYDAWPQRVRDEFHAENERLSLQHAGSWDPKGYLGSQPEWMCNDPEHRAWLDLGHRGYWPKPTVVPVTAEEIAAEVKALGDDGENKGPSAAVTLAGDPAAEESPCRESDEGEPVAVPGDAELEVARFGGTLIKAPPAVIREIEDAQEQLTLTGLFAEAESRLERTLERVRHGDVSEDQARRIVSFVDGVLAEGAGPDPLTAFGARSERGAV